MDWDWDWDWTGGQAGGRADTDLSSLLDDPRVIRR